MVMYGLIDVGVSCTGGSLGRSIVCVSLNWMLLLVSFLSK